MRIVISVFQFFLNIIERRNHCKEQPGSPSVAPVYKSGIHIGNDYTCFSASKTEYNYNYLKAEFTLYQGKVKNLSNVQNLTQ